MKIHGKKQEEILHKKKEKVQFSFPSAFLSRTAGQKQTILVERENTYRGKEPDLAAQESNTLFSVN